MLFKCRVQRHVTTRDEGGERGARGVVVNIAPNHRQCSGRNTTRKRGTRPRKRERPKSSKTAISRGISRSGRETDCGGVTVCEFRAKGVCPGVCQTHEVAVEEPPKFEEFVDQLRIRLDMADELSPSELHSFKTLMSDWEPVPETWYWNAFEELEAQGHLEPASSKVFGDAAARLSADGRLYIRENT
jgi:hypothetical protein